MSETAFYNRSALRALGVPIPDAFVALDKHLAAQFSDITVALISREHAHGHNICRRYGDLLLMEENIRQSLAHPDIFIGAELASSYLAAYFSAAKSLLDAAAIAINDIYRLDLPPKDQDFSKARFWKAFEFSRSSEANRYKSFRPWFQQVISWRDSAIHRVKPLVVVHGPGDPAAVPRSKMEIKMVASLDASLEHVIRNYAKVKWISPLEIPQCWRDFFLRLITLVCEDLCVEWPETRRS